MSGQAGLAALQAAAAANLTTLSALPTTYDGSLTGAVDINAAFTLGSGYLVRHRGTLLCLCPVRLQHYRCFSFYLLCAGSGKKAMVT